MGFAILLSILVSACHAEYASLSSDELVVFFLPKHESDAKTSLRILQEARHEIASQLQLPENTPASVILVPSQDQFKDLIGPTFAHLRVLGVARLGKGQILINLSQLTLGAQDPINDTLAHEMVHLMLNRFEEENGGRLPRWFHEGVSCWLGRLLPTLPEEDRRLRLAASSGTLIPFYELDHSFPEFRSDSELAYLQSEHFIRFLVKKHGPDAIARILASLSRLQELRTAVPEALGVDLLDEEAEWAEGLKSPFPLLWFLWDDTTLWALGAMVTILSFWLYRRRRARKLLDWDKEQAETIPGEPPTL